MYWTSGASSAVLDGKWKFVSLAKGKREELYDLEQDPNEKKDIAAQNPQEVSRLRAVLESNAKLDLASK